MKSIGEEVNEVNRAMIQVLARQIRNKISPLVVDLEKRIPKPADLYSVEVSNERLDLYFQFLCEGNTVEIVSIMELRDAVAVMESLR